MVFSGGEGYGGVGAAFSPDGKFVVTQSWDGTARVWDAATGQSLAELCRHTDPVFTATFSPNGKFVVTASAGGTTEIFACEICGSIEDLLALARTRVTRELTCEERQTYLHENIACPTPTPKP
jgi:WD40 repeat protein